MLLFAPALLTLGGGHFVRLNPHRAPRIALAAFGVQASLLVFAWLLLSLLPREGNRQGGTCASYRQSELDEVVFALGWVSAIISGVAFAGSVIASRQTNVRAGWFALALGSVVLPYAIFASLVITGLCYALDT